MYFIRVRSRTELGLKKKEKRERTASENGRTLRNYLGSVKSGGEVAVSKVCTVNSGDVETGEAAG